ncbi:hypothetical protein [Modicisalibacter sp. MOD 31.J]|uniref:hypothetical protein n=1 Tax=Modicisalibacter sp. MOD 31.J TaxID=2831897 RepID=UPI001CCAFF03|nr:hypothetical protein [Modicisalibacter sp. MOD 31.J]MBZ9574554.1 hypothetical protein [Modicisalibacter sp. MOD 31.J]
MSNAAIIAAPATLDAESACNDETGTQTDPRWEEVYKLCRFAEEGISLEAFLAAPWRVLSEQGQEGAVESIRSGHQPLLPKQARVARRLRAEGFH